MACADSRAAWRGEAHDTNADYLCKTRDALGALFAPRGSSGSHGGSPTGICRLIVQQFARRWGFISKVVHVRP